MRMLSVAAFLRRLRPFAPVRAWLVGIMLAWAGMAPGLAAELVMFERPGCPWCVRWHKEIGSIYPKTPEGERAPLKAVMLDRQSQSAYRLKEPVFYTPTFVLVEKGEEIGRITGYMGDDAFWSLMKMLAGKLESVDQAGK
ncbi:MAG: thioredoxin family protein [Beijerinckiaceae bacterium]|nr:thioredoxin family protein [Beijerinckiaceae bacterium]MCZ8299175.1 thioredoxin family protein [Beijerinckiaceae bacterium]